MPAEARLWYMGVVLRARRENSYLPPVPSQPYGSQHRGSRRFFGELSANKAMIEAGFRKPPKPRLTECPGCGCKL